MKNKNNTDVATVENIDVWWDIPSYWSGMSYEKKLEHYWKYEYKDGQRIISRDDDTTTNAQHNNKSTRR